MNELNFKFSADSFTEKKIFFQLTVTVIGIVVVSSDGTVTSCVSVDNCVVSSVVVVGGGRVGIDGSVTNSVVGTGEVSAGGHCVVGNGVISLAGGGEIHCQSQTQT